MIAVPTDADSRYAVSTHATPFSEVCRSCWIVGSAGTTAELSIANARPATESTASVTFGWLRLSSCSTRGG